MSRSSSFNQTAVDRQLIKVGSELLQLKAKQQYDPNQINYAYQSNNVSVSSYVCFSGDTRQGIIASFIFTSHFPNLYPRVSFDWTRTSGSGGNMVYQRVERYSANQTQIFIELVDSMVPMSTPTAFSIDARVYSNVAGTLKLESTYVLPAGG